MNESFWSLITALLFVVSYVCYDLYTATMILMLSSLPLLWFNQGLSTRLSVLLIWLLGSLTLIFRSESFIKLKPTFLFWALAMAWVMSLRKPVSWGERLLQAAGIRASGMQIMRLNWAAIVFYLGLGLLNALAAYWLSTTLWVWFKTLGIPLLQGLAILGGLRLLRLGR